MVRDNHFFTGVTHPSISLTSSPGVVPETAPIVLFLEADNFGDFDSGFLQLDKVVKSRTARRTAADQADSHFTSWCHGCIIVDDGQN